MKISRPPSGAVPGAPGGSPEIKAPKGKDFAAKLEKADRASEARAPQEATRAAEANSAGRVPGIAEVGADLRAGRINAQAALDRVVQRVLDQQVGANAPAAVREKLAAVLRQTLEDDPVLAAKVRSLGE
jgi:hypothetical protein